MERFRVIGMNWAPHYAFPVILVTIWFQRVLHLEPVFLMAKEEENGPKWILSVNVSLFVWKSFISTIASMARKYVPIFLRRDYLLPDENSFLRV